MLTVSGRHFERDGKRHLIVSGAIHYARVHPGHWADRLRRLRAMGANTVETYIPWNWHAPARGVVDFTGSRDLGRFLDLAAEADLDVIVRPGPYICAEWEGGGFPGWLLEDRSIRLRCSDPAYLREVDRWFDVLIPVVAARQVRNGGRVIMVQVENEYGSYGEDKAYLAHLRDGLLRRGISAMLVTSDGPSVGYLAGGAIDGALPMVNFGSGHQQALELLEQEYGDQPAMCMEFWNGWFDHWGEPHHSRGFDDAAKELDGMLGRGMSVNVYMAHGGTNFGLWNGSNYDRRLQPTVTSYDYDAPIAENGALTPKFWAFRDVIRRHVEVPEIPADLHTDPPVLPAGELRPVASTHWGPDQLRALSRAALAVVPGLRAQEEPVPFPPAFEDLGLERGLLVLSTTFEHAGGEPPLRLFGLHDRAHVYCDGELVGIAGRDEREPEAVTLSAERGLHRLDVVVESLGRINFGPLLGERKGLLGGSWLETRYLMGWQAWPVPLDVIGGEILAQAGEPDEGRGFVVRQYELVVAPDDAGRDAFLDTAEVGRGFVLVGEEMIGRCWSVGPQRTLYVPGPLLKAGSNLITVIATDGAPGVLRTVGAPILDGATPDEGVARP
ncbi:glycoside hydrolase family 35 protein [Tessaracoccus caeni]|uniref:glycoside hydrolase family 35 protein n=1 Tax=Tessaracoccus caeni TaxID=3031239 RepID=UPI0023DADAC4|nr:beta-galactosidase family protein [Tessaracoccus caeni]MDF1487008.1 beta-galactosidase [Tessaracoccus caeni]